MALHHSFSAPVYTARQSDIIQSRTLQLSSSARAVTNCPSQLALEACSARLVLCRRASDDVMRAHRQSAASQMLRDAGPALSCCSPSGFRHIVGPSDGGFNPSAHENILTHTFASCNGLLHPNANVKLWPPKDLSEIPEQELMRHS